MLFMRGGLWQTRDVVCACLSACLCASACARLCVTVCVCAGCACVPAVCAFMLLLRQRTIIVVGCLLVATMLVSPTITTIVIIATLDSSSSAGPALVALISALVTVFTMLTWHARSWVFGLRPVAPTALGRLLHRWLASVRLTLMFAVALFFVFLLWAALRFVFCCQQRSPCYSLAADMCHCVSVCLCVACPLCMGVGAMVYVYKSSSNCLVCGSELGVRLPLCGTMPCRCACMNCSRGLMPSAQMPAIMAVYAFAEDGSKFQSHRPAAGSASRAVNSDGKLSTDDVSSDESAWQRLLDRAQHYLAPRPTPAQVTRRFIDLRAYVASLVAYCIVVGLEWGGNDADKGDGFYNAVEVLVFDIAILSTAVWYVCASSRCM